MGASHSAPSPPQAPAPRYQSRLLPPSRPGRPELSRTGVIRNSVNVKRNSVKWKQSPEGEGMIIFQFDSATDGTRFKVWFEVTEFLDDKKMPIFSSSIDCIESDVFPQGMDQEWSFQVPLIMTRDLSPTSVTGDKTFPIIIESVPADSTSPKQLTYLCLPAERSVAVLKQKLRFGEKGYELHEIFGIEKGDVSPTSSIRNGEAEIESVAGTDCVICLSEPRDTTVLPCRHLCLCARCAEVLRANSRRCPICRQPVSSMLQIDRDIHPDVKEAA
jgi:E3 ubiquitin-protein ligase MGRN1